MYPQLSSYIENIVSNMDSISKERKNELEKIARFISDNKMAGKPANLVFICTHNSRRSHISQIWAATAAAHCGIEKGVYTFSGGTEATAFNPRAVSAIERSGFDVKNPGGENPRYKVQFANKGPVMVCWSKTFDDPSNPKENFAAVMTCSEADENCPFIPGAALRVPIAYIDPKESDDTDQEVDTYDERCRQIAREMLYMMLRTKKLLGSK